MKTKKNYENNLVKKKKTQNLATHISKFDI